VNLQARLVAGSCPKTYVVHIRANHHRPLLQKRFRHEKPEALSRPGDHHHLSFKFPSHGERFNANEKCFYLFPNQQTPLSP
jgi:hypothetical protein